MRAFGATGWMLSDARVEVRAVYTGFLLLTLVGLATMAVFQWKHIGPGPADVAVYFRGGERDGAMVFAKTFRELAEMTHFHAFVMGIVYLILAHLVIATSAPDVVKRGAIVLAFVGLAGDLVGPWLIRFVSPVFAWAQVSCWLAEWVGFAAFIFYPIREMWFRAGRDARSAG